ncbi:autotransporter outer membrane beta-barrel domain-containing protein [Mitsuokella sp. AF21-1AC]|nr:autotransporter outer membrane beta-barrel domain-containing protein [Mitsuokella sp. AF21-1AC]
MDITGGQISHANMLVGAVGKDVSNNHVAITGGKIEGTQYILGGYGESNVNQETVTIGKDAVVTAAIIGGGYMADSVLNNMVTVSGTVTGYMIGGSVLYGGIVSGNVLNLAGAALNTLSQTDTSLIDFLKEDGYKEIGESIQAVGGSLGEYGIKAQDNRINLSGSMDLSKTNLYGWSTGVDMKQDASGDDTKEITHSGNTLNVGYLEEMTTDKEGKNTITGKAADWHGSKVRGIYNFDKIAFYNVDPSQPALTVTDTVSLPDNVTLNLDHFASADGGQVLKDDVLIDASGAATVKGLDKLYESGKDKYQQTLTQTYADGGVEVTGKAGLSLSDNNILSYGLCSLEDITYKTIDWQTDGTVLTLADSRKFDLANTKVHTENIGFTAKSLENITKAGDYSMTLLDTQGNKTLEAGNLTTKQGKWNISNALEGMGVASLDANGNVIYTMDTVQKKNGTEIKVDTSKQTHNALIANEAGLGVLAAGRDRLDSVLTNFNGQEGGVFTFASLGGSKNTYDTGSESKTYTWNGLVGIGNEAATKDGDFSYGLFYEYGKGHYSVDGAGYTGSGDAHYNGGGLMAKYMARNKNYVEGSLHFGNLKNNADSVLHSSDGSAYGYNTSSNYWSGHVGFGHIFDLTDKVESTSLGGTQRAARDLDVYGKYFYTHVGGDSFRAGEANYQLDGMNSSLLRIGARVNNRSGWNNYYYGLAWDYEFDGESNGTVSAAGLSAPIRKADIGGSSLMAEAGWKLESNQENPWEVNLSMQAYAGQHKGLGGNVYMAYHF